MSFQLAPSSVTLDDLERHNSPNSSIISLNLVAFGQITLKWLKIHQYFLQQKCRPKILVFSDILLMAILAGRANLTLIYSSESIKVRHSPLASENLTNNQP